MHSTTSTWLEPIPGLWRDEAAHRYWLGDHLFPVSITGVLAHGLSDTAKAIEHFLADTAWQNSWSVVLLRLSGAQRAGPVRFCGAGMVSRAVAIPLGVL